MKEEIVKNVNEEELRKMFRNKESFKIRVTPELSRTIQEIGFEEGSSWSSGDKEILYEENPFLFYEGAFYTDRGRDNYFSSIEIQEICFIETKEKSFFSSQKEIWKYLVEEEGRKVFHIGKENQLVGFKEGELWNFKEDRKSHIDFVYSSKWKLYVEKPWYENIPEQGVLCWIGDDETSVLTKKLINIVVSYTIHNSFPYTLKSGCTYKFAIPLTKEEVENLIWKKKE